MRAAPVTCKRVKQVLACRLCFGMRRGQRLPRVPSGVKAQVVSLESVIKAGKEHPRSHIPPEPTDIATLCYTSGTTGVPKGRDAVACQHDR